MSTRSVLRGTLALALLLLTSATLRAQAVTLEAGDRREGSLAAGDTALFSFSTGEDFFVYGSVDQRSVDVRVQLLNSEGEVVSSSNTSSRGLDAFGGPLRPAGDWTVRLTAVDEDGAGDFEIRMERLEARSDDPEELAAQLMHNFRRDDGPGSVIRVWRDGRTVHSEARGLANLAYGIEFDAQTPTNIGSTSKQFTAMAVMLEQEAGRLSLEDPLSDYFPDFPTFANDITVRNLITHTSGLREFLNLYVLSGTDTRSLSRADVLRAVQRQPALQNEPYAEFNYNNTAFSLAAQIVEQTSGQEFGDYVRDNIFLPLGMNDSYVRMTPDQIIPGASEGYTLEDGWRARGDLGGAVGAGGIYASVEDLERWGMNLLADEPTVGSRETIDEMMTEVTLTDGSGSTYGYGLFIDEQRGLNRVHHGGADVSHRSMLILYPEIDAGITLQSNASVFNSQGFAMELGAAFFDDAMEPEDEEIEGDFDPASYDPADFDRLVGEYTLDPAPQVRARMFREGDTYRTQLTGQQPVTLEPIGPNSFRIVEVDARVVFNDGDPAPGFTLFQNGQEVPASRVTEEAEEAADAAEPDAEALAEYAGRYYSEELEAFYTLRVEEEDGEASLIVNQLRMGDWGIEWQEADSFASDVGITIEFERDRNGNVIALYADITRSRDVRFVRIQ